MRFPCGSLAMVDHGVEYHHGNLSHILHLPSHVWLR